MKNKTKQYYNENAQNYFNATKDLNLNKIYQKFLPKIAKKGKILDVGAGSGRDSFYFSNCGYTVNSIDISENLIKLAKLNYNIDVWNIDILNLEQNTKYDGIWACASLLHLDSKQLKYTLLKLENMLKPNGIIYISFKYGKNVKIVNKRYFNNLTLKKFEKLNKTNLKIQESWFTKDIQNRNVKWLNLILEKNTKI